MLTQAVLVYTKWLTLASGEERIIIAIIDYTLLIGQAHLIRHFWIPRQSQYPSPKSESFP